MSESVADVEDWSLQAIVRGSSGEFGKIVDMEMDGHDSFLEALASDHHHHQQHHHHRHQYDRDLFSNFPDIFEGSSDELEDLYKPFYYAPATTSSLPDQTILEFQEQTLTHDKTSQNQSDQSPATSPVASITAVYTPKYKKRKNQQKRVVIQVSAEGLSSDMWAWRKYGQKPIKGSPYPRSYYRCSSSKGCLARKQVEQSCTDPGMFIITYTAEHSHSQPTRRNSLAGTVRQKFSSPTKQEKIDKSNSTKIMEAVPPPPRVKLERKEEKVEIGNDEFVVSDFIFNEDFFSGLEDFDEFVSHDSSSQRFPVRSCSWV